MRDRHVVTIIYQYETIYEEFNDTITFDLEWPCKVNVKVTYFEALYLVKEQSLGHMLLLTLIRKHIWEFNDTIIFDLD